MITIQKIACAACLVVMLSACTHQPAASTTANKKAVVAKPASTDTVKKIKNASLIPDITGTYISVPLEEGGETCNITVKISKSSGKYMYSFATNELAKKGNVKIAKSDDPTEKAWMVTFLGIPWASYEGDMSDPDKERADAELNVPTDITMAFLNNELTFQNYGNSMNAYTVIESCGQKWIRLVRQ